MPRSGLAAVLAAVAAAAGCSDGDTLIDGRFTDAEWDLISSLSPLSAVLPDPTNRFAEDERAVALGHALFFDARAAGPLLVGDDGQNGGLGQMGETGKIACVSCHAPESTWLDDIRSKPGNVSLGAGFGKRNAPPVVNAAFYRWFGWAGQSDTLWQQAISTVELTVSMNSSRLAVAHLLHDHYKADYEAIFGPIDPRFDPANPGAGAFPPTGKPPEPVWNAMPAEDQEIVNQMMVAYGKAIAAYERKLVSRDAPFDRYVAGDTAAISDAAKRGLKLFIGVGGCVGCHNTPLFSDNEFHNSGVPQGGPHVPTDDLGRYGAAMALPMDPFNSEGRFSDGHPGLIVGLQPTEVMKGQFRTKHLRQIAETGPYTHTGGFATLRDVIENYNAGGGTSGSFPGTLDPRIRPLNLDDHDIDDLVAFLGTLTGAPVDPALIASPPVTPPP